MLRSRKKTKIAIWFIMCTIIDRYIFLNFAFFLHWTNGILIMKHSSHLPINKRELGSYAKGQISDSYLEKSKNERGVIDYTMEFRKSEKKRRLTRL